MSVLLKSLRLLAITLLFSCSKSPEKEKVKVSGCAVASLREIYNGATTRTFYYSYDNQGRVNRVDFDAKPSATYETYTYSTDRIVVSGTAVGNGTAVYELDGNGRVARYGSATFTYNAEGYLTGFAETNGPHTTTASFTYQNGNLVRIAQVGNYGGPQPVTNTLLLEYDEALAVPSIAPGDPLNLFGATRGVLASYFGKGSKNLVKKETAQTSTAADESRTYSYTRDDKGNITLVRTVVSDGRVGEKRLTYTCQ